MYCTAAFVLNTPSGIYGKPLCEFLLETLIGLVPSRLHYGRTANYGSIIIYQMSLCLTGNNPVFPNGFSALHLVGLCVPLWLARHLSNVQSDLCIQFSRYCASLIFDAYTSTEWEGPFVKANLKKFLEIKKEPVTPTGMTDSQQQNRIYLITTFHYSFWQKTVFF